MISFAFLLMYLLLFLVFYVVNNIIKHSYINTPTSIWQKVAWGTIVVIAIFFIYVQGSLLFLPSLGFLLFIAVAYLVGIIRLRYTKGTTFQQKYTENSLLYAVVYSPESTETLFNKRLRNGLDIIHKNNFTGSFVNFIFIIGPLFFITMLYVSYLQLEHSIIKIVTPVSIFLLLIVSTIISIKIQNLYTKPIYFNPFKNLNSIEVPYLHLAFYIALSDKKILYEELRFVVSEVSKMFGGGYSNDEIRAQYLVSSIQYPIDIEKYCNQLNNVLTNTQKQIILHSLFDIAACDNDLTADEENAILHIAKLLQISKSEIDAVKLNFSPTVTLFLAHETHYHELIFSDLKKIMPSYVFLIAYVMQTNGSLSREDIKIIRSHLYRFRVRYDNWLQEITASYIDIKTHCNAINNGATDVVKILLLRNLFMIASGKGGYSENEEKAIAHIAELLQIKNDEYEQIKGMYEPEPRYHEQQTHQDYQNQYTNFIQQRIIDAYTTLELTPDVSDEDLRTRYRQLAKEHHPDRVSYLGEVFVRQAHERFQTISAAYELIKQQRNLK